MKVLVESARRPSAGNSRSNASVFDISGVMLRMSLRQVDETMQNRGFRKIMQKYQIPNFIKWRNEEGCRHSGVVGYERLEACVVERAKSQTTVRPAGKICQVRHQRGNSGYLYQ
ncbi:MAG: hypothetical protein ACLU99_05640 [Alphaproteobacteria bacterium]